MSKPKLKKYRVTKRFELWLETEISAADFAAAVEAGKKLRSYEFMKAIVKPGSPASIIDETEIGGFGVSEDWSS